MVGTFASEVWDRVSPGGTLWLVWRNGYQGFGSSCGNLASWLQMLSPDSQTLVTQDNAITSTRTSQSSRRERPDLSGRTQEPNLRSQSPDLPALYVRGYCLARKAPEAAE